MSASPVHFQAGSCCAGGRGRQHGLTQLSCAKGLGQVSGVQLALEECPDDFLGQEALRARRRPSTVSRWPENARSEGDLNGWYAATQPPRKWACLGQHGWGKHHSGGGSSSPPQHTGRS
jgi:hypothetical protein